MVFKVNSIDGVRAAMSQNRDQRQKKFVEQIKKIDDKNVGTVRYRNETGQSLEEYNKRGKLAKELGTKAGSGFQVILEIEKEKLKKDQQV